MEIWNLKSSSSNMYSDFKLKFEAFHKVNIRQAILKFGKSGIQHFKWYTNWLKQGSYAHLKQTD